MDRSQRVAVLPPDVSRRIAAGEVIERPASVVRELIDNSLDADADEIDISWSGGGAETLRVRDNGLGLSREDLELCWQPHATSKIRTIDDLETTKSLGFRGEALSSIAAVSTMSIASAERDAPQGYRLTVDRGEFPSVEPAPPTAGTIVEVRQLFANLPARRRFLSRPQAETTAIRNTIRDKAMPFPGVRFTAQSENGTKTTYQKEQIVTRVSSVYGSIAPVQSLHEIEGTGDGFSLTIVAAEPHIVRRDRRYIRTFVNKRRVWEFQLTQAIEYAYQDVQHGGLYPIAALFLEIDPHLVDFNIHPAKREVRIRPAGEVHHRIVELLRSFLRAYTIRSVQFDGEFPEKTFNTPSPSTSNDYYRDRPRDRSVPQNDGMSTFDRGETHRKKISPLPAQRSAEKPPFQPSVRAVPSDDLTYIGTIFETYIVVQRDERVYIIDQHAAHERLLYNHLQNERSTQPLLVAEEFDTTEDQDNALRQHEEEYRKIGIKLVRIADRRWRIDAIPPEYTIPIETLIETILDLTGLNEQLDRIFLAELACKAAVKGGDFVDGLTATELARRTLALEVPRCPHGRPLWVELTRQRLETLIGRV